MASRRQVAERFGISEATLRTAEENGSIPPFNPARLGEYMNAVAVWRAARAGGASTQQYRRAIGAMSRTTRTPLKSTAGSE